MEATDLLEPAKLYKSQIKPLHKQNCEEFYDNLVKESKIDVELNRTTNKNIKAKNSKIEAQQKSLSGKRAIKTLLIILGVLAFIGSFVLFILAFQPDAGDSRIWKIVGAITSAIVGVVVIIIAIKKVGKAIKNIVQIIEKLTKERNSLIAEARAQMEPLNSLFDWNIPATLFSKTIPLIQLDPFFDETKFQMLHEKYDFNGNPEKNISSVFVQSGSILGNPFLIEKNYVQEMHDVPYTGSITISWTTTYTDSEGHTHTQHHSETLTATIYKPAPYYYYDTMLVYGNDAAPNLSFSRSPSDANKMNEKQLQKFIDSYDKKLDKMTQKSISKGTNFQRLGNNEFEALFNALDRDNNIEFRLLFTPLAQNNMVSLITTKEPYGDDFHFLKRKSLNYIKSEHSQYTNFEGDPCLFESYDHDSQRAFFLEYNDKFMQSLYYDLAPIMSIPLYQQHAAQEYIYKGTLTRNVTEMETEVMANSYNKTEFAPSNGVTDVILKTSLIAKQGTADLNKVTAYSFKTIQHVEYVSKLGGDGSMHRVPVEWLEYIPVKKESEIVVQRCETTQKEYKNNYTNGKFKEILSQFASKNAMIYKKGFISFQSSKNAASYNGNELNKIFKKGDK